MWPRTNLHVQLLENALNPIRPAKGSRVIGVSLVNGRSEEQEVALCMAHATLTCWNATSMLFAAALGTRRRPLSHQQHKKASLCACKRGPKREQYSAYESMAVQREVGRERDVTRRILWLSGVFFFHSP
ncbi:hypothetical protein INR49_001320 [Caranx melampygus]|nr:hypothetical protein INR49_001320 [Caranx melampygus]